MSWDRTDDDFPPTFPSVDSLLPHLILEKHNIRRSVELPNALTCIRHLLLSLSNNFPWNEWNDDHFSDDILIPAGDWLVEHFSLLLRSSRGSTVKVITRTFFQFTIKRSKADVVEALLQDNTTGININEEIIITEEGNLLQ